MERIKEEKAKEYASRMVDEPDDDTLPEDDHWTPLVGAFEAGFEAGKQEERKREAIMIETLVNIARPVAYFQRKAKKENAKVDGFYVQQLANNAHILREFAENCLKAFGIDIDAELENLSK